MKMKKPKFRKSTSQSRQSGNPLMRKSPTLEMGISREAEKLHSERHMKKIMTMVDAERIASMIIGSEKKG